MFKLSHAPSMDKLYYLAHPLYTYGSADLNRSHALEIQRWLKGIHIINPILLIPPAMSEPAAMEKCLGLLSTCDGIILAPSWDKSVGCQEEQAAAEEWDMEIIEILEVADAE